MLNSDECPKAPECIGQTGHYWNHAIKPFVYSIAMTVPQFESIQVFDPTFYHFHSMPQASL